jgi:hypothetical protein
MATAGAQSKKASSDTRPSIDAVADDTGMGIEVDPQVVTCRQGPQEGEPCGAERPEYGGFLTDRTRR